MFLFFLLSFNLHSLLYVNWPFETLVVLHWRLLLSATRPYEPSVEPLEQSPGESGVQLTVRCRYRGLNYRRHVGREVPPLTDTLSQLSGFDKASDDRCFLFGCSPTAQRDLLCGFIVTGLLRQTYYRRTTSDMQKGATESDTCDAELFKEQPQKNGHFLLEIVSSKRKKVRIYIYFRYSLLTICLKSYLPLNLTSNI